MLKSLEIWNFESHEHTVVHFGTNFNLIVGPSNSGKSSIIRAASVVTANKWSKEQVRNGYEYCRIKLTTDRGWVECERGEKVNRWRVFDGNDIQEYKNVGTGVPDTVPQVLGMCEQDRGEVKEMPNFMFQLDKHYMLAEIDGKKATSNLVARMMDNAIGLGGMEDLIKVLSTDLTRDKKWLTEKQSEIVELKTQIIDNVIFDNYKKSVEGLTTLYTQMQDMETDLQEANRLKADLDRITNDLSRLVQLPKPNSQDLTNALQSLKMLKNKIALCEDILSIMQTLECIKSLSIEDLNSITALYGDLKVLGDKIKKAEQKLIEARMIWKRIEAEKKAFKENTQKYAILQKDYNELKKKLKICPLCGGELKYE